MINKILSKFPEDIRLEIQQARLFIFDYLKNPIQKIRFCPNWDWRTLILIQALIGSLGGFFAGLVSRSIIQAIAGLIVIPITSLIASLLTSALFYYIFQFGFNKIVDFKKIFTLIVLTNIYLTGFLILEPLLPPIPLVGLAFSGLLLVVGFSENFDLDRTKVMKTVSVIYLIFFVLWIAQTLYQNQTRKRYDSITIPQDSLKILEEDLKN